KCCLNYELDTYMEAVKAFPKKADRILTEAGKATLVKTDIFKQLMFYSYVEGRERGKLYALSIEQVQEVIEMNKAGDKPYDLGTLAISLTPEIDKEDEHDYYGDLTGVIDLPIEKRKKKNRRNKRKKPAGNSAEASAKGRSNHRSHSKGRSDRSAQGEDAPQQAKDQARNKGETKEKNSNSRRRGRGRGRNHRKRNNNSGTDKNKSS
ncbi:MAG: hypothetical protein D6772_16125, partial [Bacteroidetes bacterium]